MSDFTIIDSHCHPFFIPEQNINYFRKKEMTPEEFVSDLRAAGISCGCGSLIITGWHSTFAEVSAMNAEGMRFAAAYPDFFIPGLSVHASFPEESCAEIQRYFNAGKLRWIGEWVPYVIGTEDYGVRSLFPVYDLAQSLELPIDIHPIGCDLEVILRNFPKLNLIMAHPGDLETYRERVELMKKYPNLHLCICGTGLFRWGMLRYGVETLGSSRFLFGTDYPVCNAAMQVAGVMSEHITDADREAIFSGNFLRLAKMA